MAMPRRYYPITAVSWGTRSCRNTISFARCELWTLSLPAQVGRLLNDREHALKTRSPR
jgi:hypothetical protein